MDEQQNLGREALIIGGVEVSFVKAVVDIAEVFAMINQPGLEILANTTDKVPESSLLSDADNPLVVAFIGWHDREEVTASGREIIAGTDKILENLGLAFRLG